MKTLLYSLCAILIFQASFGLLANCGMEQISNEPMSEMQHMMPAHASSQSSTDSSDHDCCDPEIDSSNNSIDMTNCECDSAAFSLAIDLSNSQISHATNNQFFKDRQLPCLQILEFELLRPPISV